MRYKTILTEGDEVDNDGEDFKVIENDNGSVSITFSNSWIQRMGWQVGDYITWEFNDDGTVSITNQQANFRLKAREILQR